MGKATFTSVAAIARCRSMNIGDVGGSRGDQIPSIVIVTMVFILVLEEQTNNEPRTSSHSLRSLLLRSIPCTMWRRGRPDSRPHIVGRIPASRSKIEMAEAAVKWKGPG